MAALVEMLNQLGGGGEASKGLMLMLEFLGCVYGKQAQPSSALWFVSKLKVLLWWLYVALL